MAGRLTDVWPRTTVFTRHGLVKLKHVPNSLKGCSRHCEQPPRLVELMRFGLTQDRLKVLVGGSNRFDVEIFH